MQHFGTKWKIFPAQVKDWTFKMKITVAVCGYIGIYRPDYEC
jgi:hypothetical protein